MTAVYLLPIVSCIVASATGALISQILPDPSHALLTLVTSYVLWGIGVPLAMVMLVIYFHRLLHHKLPPREVIVSVFLPLGPLGQGGFGIMQMGKAAVEILPKVCVCVYMSGSTVLESEGFRWVLESCKRLLT